ncbi:MAG: ACP S-malonyltransferase [Erysipelotrichaceae bacterium]|nr:ACP S-malonyltransferase [Erysipelotrichaceae bacterium]
MKIAFLFAGQGVQKVGMGADVYLKFPASRKVYDAVDLDFDLKKLCFDGPQDQLNDTNFTQSCLLVTSLAIAHAAVSEGIIPSAVAGLSLGEYSALTFAKAFTLSDAVNLVRKRGQIMASALPIGTSSMAAVLSDDIALIESVCKDEEVRALGVCDVANKNSVNQTVISGNIEALAKATELLIARGVRRVMPLNVSGAFHSSLLIEASKELNVLLNKVPIETPLIDVYFNISGQPESDIISALTRQIHSTVQFVSTIENMVKDGVDTFVEIGPGTVLSGFVKKIAPQVKVFAIEDEASIVKLKGELR